MVYFSLMASIGLIFIDFRAGTVPAALPRTKNVATITTASQKLISKPGAPKPGTLVILSAAARTIVANTTPEVPATRVRSTLSDSICTTMSTGLAPMARRIPISRVRSLTIIHIMFPTPITPAISEPMPTKNASIARPMKRLLMVSNISDTSMKLIALSSAGWIGWLSDTARRIPFCNSAGVCPSSAVYMKNP